ncbi:MAG: tetratricopeptide repeat protein [Candidatus Nitrosotenuis sp.]
MSGVAHPVDVIKKLFADRKWDEVIEFCKKMLDDDPDDMIALQNLASAYIRIGRFTDAVSACDTVLSLNPYDEYALKNKVYALENLKRYEEAMILYDKLLEKNPSDIWAMDGRGLALNQIGRHEEALSWYDRALKHNPNDVTALVNAAATLAFLKMYGDAVSYYDRAQKIDPSLKGVAIAKSEAYYGLGMEDDALLAAQGMLNEDIGKLKEEARKRRMRPFDLLCLNEFNELEAKEKHHQEKMRSKSV